MPDTTTRRGTLGVLAPVLAAVLGATSCGTVPAPGATARTGESATKAVRHAVDPRQRELNDLALSAATGLDRQPPAIHTTPLARVGEPVWFSDTNDWGPLTATITSRGSTVTVTATVEAVTWLTGDGAAVACTTGGTPRPHRHGAASPDCGHTYTEASRRRGGGTYLLTATTHWGATWTADTGHEGHIDLYDLTATAPIRVTDAHPHPFQAWR